VKGFADPGRFGSVAIDEWRLLICEVGTYPDRHSRPNVVFSSIKSGNTIFPLTIKHQLSTIINRASTPRLTGQAKATPDGRYPIAMPASTSCDQEMTQDPQTEVSIR
jgi:hypothetical protein